VIIPKPDQANPYTADLGQISDDWRNIAISLKTSGLVLQSWAAMGQVFDIGQLDMSRLLEQWRWLCGESLVLVARNGFGDLFLRTAEGKVMWLNVGSGTLAEVAESESTFKDSLRDQAKRETWLAEQQLETLAERGLRPNDLQCIGFKVPVVFAESANVPNNAYVADLYEQVSFLGDLHRQIADSPNGAQVRLRVGQPPTD